MQYFALNWSTVSTKANDVCSQVSLHERERLSLCMYLLGAYIIQYVGIVSSI